MPHQGMSFEWKIKSYGVYQKAFESLRRVLITCRRMMLSHPQAVIYQPMLRLLQHLATYQPESHRFSFMTQDFSC